MIFLLALVLGALSCSDCRERRPVDSVEALPYPRCEGELPPEGQVVASRRLLPAESIRDRYMRESFRIRRRGCLWVIDVHYEWQAGLADVQVVYDDALRPLRAWRRMLRPGSDPDTADIRRYELRTDPVTITQRAPDGSIRHFELHGERPTAVLGPGRGLLSMWIRKTKLAEGETTRGPVLGLQGAIESIETVPLRRDPDRQEPWHDGPLQVYSVYGREPVFADAEGIVTGDLAGLRPASAVDAPVLRHEGQWPPPDPTGTP